MQAITSNHICLLHGWGFDSGVMKDLARDLEQDNRVSLLELPGYPGALPAGRMPDLDAIVEVISREIPHGSILAGWSLGGMIAIRIAGRLRETIKALVLIASTPCFTAKADWPHGIKANLIERMARRIAAGDREKVLTEFTMLVAKGDADETRTVRRLNSFKADKSASNEVLIHGLDFLVNADLRDELARLSCPVFMLLGENDHLVTAATGAATKKIYPSVRLEYVETAGHAPFISRPQKFQEVFNGYLREID